ncbi:MAG: SPOR domain-containing protein [Candidatus Neomarinimicrobiota bacterium]|jgi:hypothetical protein|nr:SPOR domain-containing protein [Candidatus Neomarinimicrobiota bacterium]MDD3965528.1 SPOR domain-containing protein [Candidatus Neomarinimicrobiota bacterium]
MKKFVLYIAWILLSSSLNAQAFQQEFLDPSDVRTAYRIKEFKILLHSDETVFPINTLLTEREYIETSGYRIQLISTQDRDEAMRVKAQADKNYELPVYVDFEPPNYKVRIGNFAKQEEAMRFQEIMQARGFKFAWVVPSKIVIQK